MIGEKNLDLLNYAYYSYKVVIREFNNLIYDKLNCFTHKKTKVFP